MLMSVFKVRSKRYAKHVLNFSLYALKDFLLIRKPFLAANAFNDSINCV